MTDATRRVTQWIIGVRGEVPLVEELATAEDVQSFVCGHVRWSDGTPGPALELEDIDWTTVDWHFVLKVIDFIGNSVYSAYAELQHVERQSP
jgi:hypothetical protein